MLQWPAVQKFSGVQPTQTLVHIWHRRGFYRFHGSAQMPDIFNRLPLLKALHQGLDDHTPFLLRNRPGDLTARKAQQVP